MLAVFVDNADLARANSIVDANKGLGGSFIESDGTPPERVHADWTAKSVSPPAGERIHEYSIGLDAFAPWMQGMEDARMELSANPRVLAVRRHVFHGPFANEYFIHHQARVALHINEADAVP